MIKMVVCLNIREAVKILKEHGVKISEAMLRAGLEQKAYPFGEAVTIVKHTEYNVYKKLLLDWIAEREVTENV